MRDLCSSAPVTVTLLVLMLGFNPPRALGQTSPPGQAAFDRVCRVCHGPQGRGDAAPALVPLEKDAAEVLAIVREGRGEMPPVSTERVSEDEVQQIVAFLKSLSPQSAALSGPQVVPAPRCQSRGIAVHPRAVAIAWRAVQALSRTEP
jgi:mono/diheme cytochrome c family protein